MILVVLAQAKKTDERSYGCSSMSFGPFKEPVTSYVRIHVQGKHYFLLFFKSCPFFFFL